MKTCKGCGDELVHTKTIEGSEATVCYSCAVEARMDLAEELNEN